MTDPAEQHWESVIKDARQQAHANATHCADLLGKVFRGCHDILLATEAIEGKTNRELFVEDVYHAMRRCVLGKSSTSQLEVEVQASWEARR